jgi:hypothetical protein
VIHSENAPTLCPMCSHFTKGADVGCRIGNHGVTGVEAEHVRRWLKSQHDETSWTYTGPCPGFDYSGSSPAFMGPSERIALRLLTDGGCEP